MNQTFYLPKLELRNKDKDGLKQYIVRGYATTPNHIYSYKYETDLDGNAIRSFKEYFTERAIDNIKRKIKKAQIFVDPMHQIGTKLNVGAVLDTLAQKTGKDISEEKDYILSRMQNSEIPMFKIEDISIDDKGLFVDIRGNPFFREIDETHKNYFDSVWGSLQNGFINGMSLNFKPTDFSRINDSLTQINDVDIFGVSLVSGASNDMADITEVAMRCIENVRGVLKCQKKKKTSLLI